MARNGSMCLLQALKAEVIPTLAYNVSLLQRRIAHYICAIWSRAVSVMSIDRNKRTFVILLIFFVAIWAQNCLENFI